LQRSSSSSWIHRTPAGFPAGIPGIGVEMDGAVQQAPQRSRQFILQPFTLWLTIGLPPGMPRIGPEMEGAMQQAPQLGRQFMRSGNGRSATPPARWSGTARAAYDTRLATGTYEIKPATGIYSSDLRRGNRQRHQRVEYNSNAYLRRFKPSRHHEHRASTL
jgi:hypothetical protein